MTALLLDADGYVVLYRSGRDIHIDDAGLDLPLDKFPASLVNTGKELALFDPSGKEIDRIAYEKAKVGIAWERSETGFHLSRRVPRTLLLTMNQKIQIVRTLPINRVSPRTL